MKNLVVPTLLATAVVGVLAGVIYEPRLRRMEAMLRGLGPPNQTTIRLSGTPSACTAVVYDDPVGNKHEKHVTWDINEDCSLEGRWHIELEFTPNAKGQYPFQTQTVRSQGNVNQFVHEKIKKRTEVDPGDFKYTIYLVQGSNRTMLLDPELEIVY